MDKEKNQEGHWQCPICDTWNDRSNKFCPSCQTKKPGLTEENEESEVLMMDNGMVGSQEEIAESPLSPDLIFHKADDTANKDDLTLQEKTLNYSIISYKSRFRHTKLWPKEGYQWMFFVGGLLSLMAGIFLWPTPLFASITLIAGLVLVRDGLTKISWFLIISSLLIAALAMPYGTPWGLFLTVIHS